MYMGNLKHWIESLKNKTNNNKNFWDFDNKQRCLYIYFSLRNNHLLILIIGKKPFSTIPYIPYSFVHTPNGPKRPFPSSPLHFSTPAQLPTPISRGTNTLNHSKIKVPHTTTFNPTHSQNLAVQCTPDPTEKKKRNKQLWHENLWPWIVALHMCNQRQKLSLTTVNS